MPRGVRLLLGFLSVYSRPLVYILSRCIGMSRSLRVSHNVQIRTERRRVAGKSFFGSLLAGLSAATMVYEPARRPRSYSSEGLRGDWRAVGGDIRSAMQKHDAG